MKPLQISFLTLLALGFPLSAHADLSLIVQEETPTQVTPDRTLMEFTLSLLEFGCSPACDGVRLQTFK